MDLVASLPYGDHPGRVGPGEDRTGRATAVAAPVGYYPPTMKTLLVMRHAKSDWDASFDADRDRPLAARGRKDAPRMGRFLTAVGHIPDLVIASTAVRARSTAEMAAAAGRWKCQVKVDDCFYGAVPDEVLAEIAGVADRHDRLLVVGHEPTWSGLVGLLVGGCAVRMPTAAVACIEIGGPTAGWDALEPGSGELQWLVTPRLLKKAS